MSWRRNKFGLINIQHIWELSFAFPLFTMSTGFSHPLHPVIYAIWTGCGLWVCGGSFLVTFIYWVKAFSVSNVWIHKSFSFRLSEPLCRTTKDDSLSTGNQLDMVDDLKGYLQQIPLNGYFAVDTFFLLSGLSVTYVLMKQVDRTKSMAPIWYSYLRRFWR